jgi:hypothetical protein
MRLAVAKRQPGSIAPRATIHSAARSTMRLESRSGFAQHAPATFLDGPSAFYAAKPAIRPGCTPWGCRIQKRCRVNEIVARLKAVRGKSDDGPNRVPSPPAWQHVGFMRAIRLRGATGAGAQTLAGNISDQWNAPARMRLPGLNDRRRQGELPLLNHRAAASAQQNRWRGVAIGNALQVHGVLES